jgi:hypothetical protein
VDVLPRCSLSAITTTGAAVRKYAEEQLLAVTYPECTAYRVEAARVISFVF